MWIRMRNSEKPITQLEATEKKVTVEKRKTCGESLHTCNT